MVPHVNTSFGKVYKIHNDIIGKLSLSITLWNESYACVYITCLYLMCTDIKGKIYSMCLLGMYQMKMCIVNKSLSTIDQSCCLLFPFNITQRNAVPLDVNEHWFKTYTEFTTVNSLSYPRVKRSAKKYSVVWCPF